LLAIEQALVVVPHDLRYPVGILFVAGLFGVVTLAVSPTGTPISKNLTIQGLIRLRTIEQAYHLFYHSYRQQRLYIVTGGVILLIFALFFTHRKVDYLLQLATGVPMLDLSIRDVIFIASLNY
jgi:hypothetical protein